MNKNNTKLSLLKQAQNEIERIQSRVALLDVVPVNLIYEAFPDANISLWVFGCQVDVNLPMRFALIDDVIEFCKDQFPNWTQTTNSQYISDTGNANRRLMYRVNNFDAKYERHGYVEFLFSSKTAGSTCVINKIGEEKKVVPIYEVVCSQAAADEF